MKLFNCVRRSVICGLVLGATALTSTAMAADITNAPPKLDLLTTCPVSGDKLGEMGKPLIFVYQGQEIKLCCGGCKKDFDKTGQIHRENPRSGQKRHQKLIVKD